MLPIQKYHCDTIAVDSAIGRTQFQPLVLQRLQRRQRMLCALRRRRRVTEVWPTCQ